MFKPGWQQSSIGICQLFLKEVCGLRASSLPQKLEIILSGIWKWFGPCYLEPWRWGSKAGSSPPCWKPSSKPGHNRSPRLNHRSFFWKILKTIRGIILILIAAPESSMDILSQRSAIKGFGAAPLYFCKCQTYNWIIGILEDHGPIKRPDQSSRMDIGHLDGKRPHSRIRKMKSQ